MIISTCMQLYLAVLVIYFVVATYVVMYVHIRHDSVFHSIFIVNVPVLHAIITCTKIGCRNGGLQGKKKRGSYIANIVMLKYHNFIGVCDCFQLGCVLYQTSYTHDACKTECLPRTAKALSRKMLTRMSRLVLFEFSHCTYTLLS